MEKTELKEIVNFFMLTLILLILTIFEISINIHKYKLKIYIIFLNECLYYKCYISIKWTFLKELMLIKQVLNKGMVLVTNLIFK